MAQPENKINLSVSFLNLFKKLGSAEKGEKGEKGENGADPILTDKLQDLCREFEAKFDSLLDIREIKGDKGDTGRTGTNGIDGVNGNNGQDFEIIFINTLDEANDLVNNNQLIINKVYLILENNYLFIATQTNDYKGLNDYLNLDLINDLVNNLNIIQIDKSDFSSLVNNKNLNVGKFYYITNDETFLKAITNESYIILNNHVNIEYVQNLIDENSFLLKYQNYTELYIAIINSTIKDDKIISIEVDNSFVIYTKQNFSQIVTKQLNISEIFINAGAEGYL